MYANRVNELRAQNYQQKFTGLENTSHPFPEEGQPSKFVQFFKNLFCSNQEESKELQQQQPSPQKRFGYFNGSIDNEIAKNRAYEEHKEADRQWLELQLQ